jgi:hypothetical protein
MRFAIDPESADQVLQDCGVLPGHSRKWINRCESIP